MRREPLADVTLEAGHARALRQDVAHRIGMQRGTADPTAFADAAEQRARLAPGDRLPSKQCLHRTGVGMLATRQADLGPLPGRIGLAPRDPDPETLGGDATS